MTRHMFVLCSLLFVSFCFFIFPQTALELNGVLNSSKKQVLFHHHFRVLARVPGLSPYFFGILFHHHVLVPARVPGLVSLLFWHPVSIIIMSWFRLGLRGLSPYFFGILFHHHFLVPARVRLVSLLFWHSVPSSVPGSA